MEESAGIARFAAKPRGARASPALARTWAGCLRSSRTPMMSGTAVTAPTPISRRAPRTSRRVFLACSVSAIPPARKAQYSSGTRIRLLWAPDKRFSRFVQPDARRDRPGPGGGGLGQRLPGCLDRLLVLAVGCQRRGEGNRRPPQWARQWLRIIACLANSPARTGPGPTSWQPSPSATPRPRLLPASLPRAVRIRCIPFWHPLSNQTRSARRPAGDGRAASRAASAPTRRCSSSSTACTWQRIAWSLSPARSRAMPRLLHALIKLGRAWMAAANCLAASWFCPSRRRTCPSPLSASASFGFDLIAAAHSAAASSRRPNRHNASPRSARLSAACRRDLQGPGEGACRLLVSPLPSLRHAEVVPGVGGSRVQFQGLLEAIRCLRAPPNKEHDTETISVLEEGRAESGRLLVMLPGRVERLAWVPARSSLLEEVFSKVGMGSMVVGRHRQSVLPDSLRGPPMAHLNPGQTRQDQQDAHRQGRPDCLWQSLQEFRSDPGEGEEQADVRDVDKAIRSGLVADLNQPDDRNQHSEEPQPADGQPGSPPSRPHHQERNRQQHYSRSQDRPPLPGMPRMGVEDRQPGRPQRLGEIPAVCLDRVGQARRDRNVAQGHNGLAVPLSNDCQCARPQRPGRAAAPSRATGRPGAGAARATNRAAA